MTYRTGNVAGFPLPAVWHGDAIVAVVVNGDQALTERICALLNGDGCTRVGMHNCAGVWSDHGHAGGRPGPPSMGADGDAPSRPLSTPVAAQEPPVGGSGRPGGSEAISGRCNAMYQGMGRVRVCTLNQGHRGQHAELRPAPPSVGPGCICNDPPPTVDKPKNGTASRPDGWACPRHGAVI